MSIQMYILCMGNWNPKLLKFDETCLIRNRIHCERCNKTPTMFIADANFGILERDALFAAKCMKHLKYKFPMNVAVQWNKTRPDKF